MFYTITLFDGTYLHITEQQRRALTTAKENPSVRFVVFTTVMGEEVEQAVSSISQIAPFSHFKAAVECSNPGKVIVCPFGTKHPSERDCDCFSKGRFPLEPQEAVPLLRIGAKFGELSDDQRKEQDTLRPWLRRHYENGYFETLKKIHPQLPTGPRP